MKSSVIRRSLGISKSKLENGINLGLILSANVVAQRATQKAPRDTGRLKRSITRGIPFKVSPKIYGITVGTNVEYARAQEFGSGIHSEDPAYRNFIRIIPKKARVLAFKWPNAPAGLTPGKDGLFFFKAVNHPGVKAQPYLRPALLESKYIIKQLIYSSVKRALYGG